MANLAIKGERKDWGEIFNIFEMLFGVHDIKHCGKNKEMAWTIEDCCIRANFCDCNYIKNNCVLFSLEEFLEKFPYKVGDKVLYKIYNVYSSIKTMTWNEEKEQVIYRLDSKNLWVATADELEEGTIKPITIEDFKANSKEWLIDTLESMSKDDALQTICDLHDELHKPQFPTTYVDCCKVLNIIPTNNLVFSNPNEESEYAYRNLALYNDFNILKVCRDAYWMMAGNWKPDWTDEELNDMYYIYFNGNTISKENGFPCCNMILIFPTEEMRDAFYENFKDLIEECKELL